jgi:arsenate reductase (thioredoxin)
MKHNSQFIYPALQNKIADILQLEIPPGRKAILQNLIDFMQQKANDGQEVNLNFICTHNSRRSQFSQLWAQTAAYYYNIPTRCYSGGVEETAFNERAVASANRSGFEINGEGSDNPRYKASFSENTKPLKMFSKLYDDDTNPTSNFAAIMTCSSADENCPYIPGTDKRISLLYDDPKEFDGTPQEAAKYDERSTQIAAELFYVFSKVNVGS